MRTACALTAACLDELAAIVKPGVTTEAIDRFVYSFGMDHGALPATLNYRGYTKSCCTSINHVVCHGIPDAKPLKEGDIVNIDVTYILDGWHGDSSRMYPVGQVKRAAERLLEVTHECLMRGVARHPARRADRRHRRGHPVICGRRALLGGARLLRPRRRPAFPRRAEHPALRQRRRRGGNARRDDLHRRADDQSRPSAREGAFRRLDGRDARPLAVGAVRAHDRRDRHRMRDLHAVARRARPARPAVPRGSPNDASAAFTSRGSAQVARVPAGGEDGQKEPEGDGSRGAGGHRRPPKQKPPSRATAKGCASASRRPARRRSPTTNCSRCCCSGRCRARHQAALPRRCLRGSAHWPRCSARRRRCCRR